MLLNNKELLESMDKLSCSIENLSCILKSFVGAEFSVKKEEKEKKRTKRKEKEERTQHINSLSLRLDHQIGSTDPSSEVTVWSVPSPLISISNVAQRRKVQRVMLDLWLDTYGDAEWICTEIKKAEIWMIGNPRAPKSQYGRFFSNWLSRGWDQHRKSINGHSGASQAVLDSKIDSYFEGGE